MNQAPTKAMVKALATAAGRERSNICPVIGVHAHAETVLLRAMDERGYIVWDGEPWRTAPRISEAGRAIAAALHPTQQPPHAGETL